VRALARAWPRFHGRFVAIEPFHGAIRAITKYASGV
jgi:hypothetical protein